jgi:hypothetical protein
MLAALTRSSSFHPCPCMRLSMLWLDPVLESAGGGGAARSRQTSKPGRGEAEEQVQQTTTKH